MNVIMEVGNKAHDLKFGGQSVDFTEVKHELVLLSKLVDWLTLSLIFTVGLDLIKRRNV